MMRWTALLALFVAVTTTASAGTALPESDDYDSFEVEPPILIPNRQIEAASKPGESVRSRLDPDQIEQQVERAKRVAIDAERLYKIGALSRLEVELRALRVVRLQSNLADAQLVRAKEQMASQQVRFDQGEIPKEELAETEVLLAAAVEAVKSAATARERAEIAAAETNLHRQQKLAAVGSARKSDVSRAEQRLADLKATND
jgi:hypothetical protein